LISRKKRKMGELVEPFRKWSRIVKWDDPVAGFLENY